MTDTTNDPQSAKPSEPTASLKDGFPSTGPLPTVVDDPTDDDLFTEDATSLQIDAGMRELVEDARSLLEYALSDAHGAEKEPIGDDIIGPVVDVAYPGDDGAQSRIRKEAWIAFLKAYDLLAIRTQPVTARTLRDTKIDEKLGFWKSLWHPKPPFQITRMLWVATAIFIALAITNDFYLTRWGPPLSGQVDGGELRTQILGVLAPFIYGGLGACAYLLRSAHALIAKRAFNVNYRPEYLNRILLGVVSGGTATLFASNVLDADGQVLKLSQAAVGFLAGYSTDFLFKTIERLLEALFPRTNPPAKN